MAWPLPIEYPGAFYHVTSRGNGRKEVFRSGTDRERFLSYLQSATTRYGERVYVYCLSYRSVGEIRRNLMSEV